MTKRILAGMELYLKRNRYRNNNSCYNDTKMTNKVAFWIGTQRKFHKNSFFEDTVTLQMLYFLKIKISLDSCQFVEYLFKIKIYIFQFLKTKKGDNVSFVYFYKIITFVWRCEKNLYSHSYSTCNTYIKFIQLV